jgi:hypothetical protein
MTLENEYTTKSIGEAAYLYLNGAVLLCAIDGRGFECFSFDDKDDCARHLAEQFYEGATAPARELFIAQSTLRQEATRARAKRQAI